MTARIPPRLIFITGTDTGVGKTVLTALLLCHLRSSGCRALAMKPFCSGGRADAELLRALQDRELTLDQINPFYFPEPIAPLVAARKRHRKITLPRLLSHMHRMAATLINPIVQQSTNPIRYITPHPTLLIEGAGGLLAPLGEGFTAADLIAELRCDVVVVARNKLGAINHTLLTVQALQTAGLRSSRHLLLAVKVVLMGMRRNDRSSSSNASIIAELLAPVPVISVPFIGRNCRAVKAIGMASRKLRRILNQVLA